jgi:serine/threonine protein phosphatase PrpC
MTWQFNSFAQTDLGLVREGNEDSALISENLIAVADGMGGHAGGEVASAIAINSLVELLSVLDSTEIDLDSKDDLFVNITHQIDAKILQSSKDDPELSGMGTTLTALNISENNVGLLHVGDSRCYRYRDKKLEQLSIDHTVMQELIDQGRLSPDEVASHPQRSLLTQALMGDSGITPILINFQIKSGDKFLLCSDGLTNVLSNYEIIKIIEANSDEEVIPALIAAVKEKGAPDNITIIWSGLSDAGKKVSVKKIGAANE